MARERASHKSDLASLRARLEQENAQFLAGLKTELEINRDAYLKGLVDKIGSYRLVGDVVADTCVDIVQALKQGCINPAAVDTFHRRRLRALGYLALLASQEVLDRFAELTDYLQDWRKAKYRLNCLSSASSPLRL